MSRVILDRETVEWTDRVEYLSAEMGLGAETERIEAEAVAEDRAARQRLSDALFREFGVRRAWPVVTRDHVIPVSGGEIRVRQYRPADASGVLPGYLVLHGGGFWLGSIDEEINDAICAQRTTEAEVTLFTVDYRLAPEHPFPTALDDAYAALLWIAAQHEDLGVDPARLIVGGASAGGNLAAALAQVARDRGGPVIAGQILEVPAVDLRPTAEWPSDYAAANGIGEISDLLHVYTGGDSAEHPYVSPAAGDVAGLPPTHVMTAEYDPTAPSAEAYVAALRAANVEVSATRHLGLLHGSAGLTARVRGARLWHAEVAAVLRDMTSR
ncbi:alpha/beta hydrolase [Microbacterium sp. RD1]|uniref:alpha/beta hydrolase n=1 Tax=Microbacterium sp. RD1 TaxID=3457313 RepID=UPI003FA52C7A